MKKNEQAKLDSLVTVNFENIVYFIKMFQSKNDIMMEKLNDITMRFNRMTDNKEDIDNLKYKMETVISRLADNSESISHHSTKFLEMETKFLEVNNKVDKSEIKKIDTENAVKAIEEKIVLHETNLNNLNRVVDANVNEIEKEKESTLRNIDDINCIFKKMNETEETIIKNQNLHEEDVKRVEIMTEMVDTYSKEQGHKVFKKLTDHEKKTNIVIEKVNKLADNINKISQIPNRLGEGIGPLIEDDTNRPIEIISKDDEEDTIYTKPTSNKTMKPSNNEALQLFEMLQKDYTQFKENYVKEIVNLRESISSLEFGGSNKGGGSFNPSCFKFDASDLDGKGKQLVDTIRLLASSVEGKASKDDLSMTQKTINKDMDKIASKLESSIIQFESKMVLMTNLIKGTGQGIDPEELSFQLNNQIKLVIQDVSKDIIQSNISAIDLSKNENYYQNCLALNNHTEELNKAFESLVDIRKNLLSKEVEDNVIDLMDKMQSLEGHYQRSILDIRDIVKALEGEIEKNEGQSDRPTPTLKIHTAIPSIRDSINILNLKMATSNEREDKIEKKLSEFNKSMLQVIKQDLKIESAKILEEFKMSLKISIGRIEEQLREKVDKFNLNEVSQRLDYKLHSEIKHKIDKADLNNNNKSINKKIDLLENKISKALVDTLIDLQIDEAPLLVKKNLKPFDRCASCNQVLQPKAQSMLNSTDFNSSGRFKTIRLFSKDKADKA